MKQKKNKNSALLAFEYLGGEVQEKVEVDLAPYEENEFVTGQERTLKHFSDWEKPKLLRTRKKINRRIFQLDLKIRNPLNMYSALIL